MKTYENENSEQELRQSNGETTDKVNRLAHSKANNSNPQPNSAPNNNKQTTQELDKADIQPTNNNQNLPNKEAGANDGRK